PRAHPRGPSTGPCPRGPRRPRRPADEPRQGLLARGGVHQGRLDRLLTDDLTVDPPLSSRSAPRDDALPRWDQGEVVLPERCPRLRPELAPQGADVERAQ